MIHHPNITSLIEMFQTPTEYQLVIELATGGELFDRIVNLGHFSETDAASLISQILSAIQYLHNEVDIVHRDLKPENLIFKDDSPDSKLLVTDFGLSKAIHDGDFLKTQCGSPHYIGTRL
jgi:calcium/calmodulin-dependent protein kinase I